jgi:hypothetical protein
MLNNSNRKLNGWTLWKCGQSPFRNEKGVAYGQCCHCDLIWTCEKKHVCTWKGPMANPKNLVSKFFLKLAWKLCKNRWVDNKKINRDKKKKHNKYNKNLMKHWESVPKTIWKKFLNLEKKHLYDIHLHSKCGTKEKIKLKLKWDTQNPNPVKRITKINRRKNPKDETKRVLVKN